MVVVVTLVRGGVAREKKTLKARRRCWVEGLTKKRHI